MVIIGQYRVPGFSNRGGSMSNHRRGTEEEQRRRRRNLALAIAFGGLAALLFIAACQILSGPSIPLLPK